MQLCGWSVAPTLQELQVVQEEESCASNKSIMSTLNVTMTARYECQDQLCHRLA